MNDLLWRKSSYSDASGGECVEVAEAPSNVLVRDSKDIDRLGLSVSPQAWHRFLGGMERRTR